MVIFWLCDTRNTLQAKMNAVRIMPHNAAYHYRIGCIIARNYDDTDTICSASFTDQLEGRLDRMERLDRRVYSRTLRDTDLRRRRDIRNLSDRFLLHFDQDGRYHRK